MQSRGDEILLLPALPRAWPAGSVTGLRARGRCSVDLRWQGGELVEAVVRGEISGRRVIRLGTRRVEIDLVPGKIVRLSGEGMVRT
ncbi:glycoside hydrolase family 95-like protein [Sphingomonas faeni]|uniref:glycoside hydrolase family 95-like protein n=1 Tax=Sphingomonas faeni TaxID=185950 RepID=UPI00359444ED